MHGYCIIVCTYICVGMDSSSRIHVDPLEFIMFGAGDLGPGVHSFTSSGNLYTL